MGRRLGALLVLAVAAAAAEVVWLDGRREHVERVTVKGDLVLVPFEKGVRGIEDEVDTATYNRDSYKEASRPIPAEERQEMTAPKFEPPTSEPKPAETNQA